MSRTTKWTVHEKSGQPKWFTHNGYYKADPTKVRKNGAGKNNWGKPGDELLDDAELSKINFNGKVISGRRNSNHNLHEQKVMSLNELCENKLY